MAGLKRNANGEIVWSQPLSIVLILAVLGGLGAALSILAGHPFIGGALIASALVAGITTFLTLNSAPSLGTIAIKTLVIFVVLAVLYALEVVFNAGSWTAVTIIGGALAGVGYLTNEINHYLAQPTPTPAPSG